ncbi:MAG TPA: ribbon-helix-helix domain-containing protein [Candidatus Paceibacterota bacterium]|nr:ribbon-helix-helix domain-containing protein [Candidatus Paceibacterota bacterium]
MKVRVSATIDQDTERKLDEVMKKGRYRNKSHIIEEAITKFIEMDKKNAK